MIKKNIFSISDDYKALFITILITIITFIPSPSNACTLTCYVDDDGTGDFNVDHFQDEEEINQAIDAVAANSSFWQRGTVILNQTIIPYEIRYKINMRYPYVNLRGENTKLDNNGFYSVKLNVSKYSPISGYYPLIQITESYINISNLHIEGNKTRNPGFQYGQSQRKEIMSDLNNRHDILLENLSAYDTTDDLIYVTAKNLTIRNIRGMTLGHTVVYVRYNGNDNANMLIENIYCEDLGNSCVRFDKINGATVRNVYAIHRYPGNSQKLYTQFGIELAVADSTALSNRNLYFENVTVMYPQINGIWVYVDPSVTGAWYLQNVTFKNILIDCGFNMCRSDNGRDNNIGDRPGAIRVQSATDIVFDGVTIVNASDGFRITNYNTKPMNITIKNSIIAKNTGYGINQVNGNTNFNWNIKYNDFWNNGANTGGSVPLDSTNLYLNPLFGGLNTFGNTNNFRLASQYGRWNGSAWIIDSTSSPLIDSGDITSSYLNEPIGNGNRINIGFDGNTHYASKSSTGPYSISGYVFDNKNNALADVFVIDNPDREKQIPSAITNSEGFFSIIGVFNGTYNLSFSKSGFNTGYLNTTIDGLSYSLANITIYDTTAPFVSGLTATKTNNTIVTLSYDATGSSYNIYRNGSLVTTTQSNSWIDNSVSVGNTYQYNVSANDTYGNQGSNSSVNITILSYTVTNLTPTMDTSIKSGQPNLSRDLNSWIDIGRLSGSTNGNYRSLLYFNVSTIPPSAKINSAILTMTWEGENRNLTSMISVYRPSSQWDSRYSSWNNKQNSVSWITQGGDWVDRNGISFGSSPYAEVTYPIGSTNDAKFNVSSIVQEYVNGKYPNTGFLLKANEIENTYISFHSFEASNANQRPKLVINYTIEEINLNLGPSITAISPYNLTPIYSINTNTSFNVTVDQQVTNKWFLDNVLQTETSRSYTKTWTFADAGAHNMTYIGENVNGTVTTTWIVTVQREFTVPSSPQNTVAIPGNNQIDISWQTPSNNGGAMITNYKIYRNGYLVETLGNILTYTDRNLTNGMEYSYQVSAINSAGEGAKSDIFIAIPHLNNVVSLTAINDTSIKSGQPNLVRSSNAWIDLGSLSGNNFGNYRGLISFDLSTIPPAAKIKNAVLTLTWEGENRNQSTMISLYRPSSLWDTQYASWNNRHNSVSWTTQGGDWEDRNGVTFGSSPYAEVIFPIGSTTDAKLNVSSIVQEYVNGKYPNTGFFLKSNEIENTYISFHSSEASNASQRPKLTIDYTTEDAFSNQAPKITAFSPPILTLQYPINSNAIFNVTTDQSVSSTWYIDGIKQDTNTQEWFNSWSLPEQHNIIYVGNNSNGSAIMAWNVSVVSTSSLYDVNLDGYVDIADLKLIKEHLGIITSAPYPMYDVNADGKVNVLDLTLVSTKIKYK